MSITFELSIKDGRTFKAWRMLNGINAQTVSEYLGIDNTYLSKIENNACPFLQGIYDKYIGYINRFKNSQSFSFTGVSMIGSRKQKCFQASSFIIRKEEDNIKQSRSHKNNNMER